MYRIVKRIVDIIFSIIFFFISMPLFIIVYCIVKMTSEGPFIHWSKRVGLNNKNFLMPKIRTMKISTPQIATHLVTDPNKYITPFGSFLRKTSFDELPQIWSIFVGDMSLVGPRPALFNQDDLIKYRKSVGVDKLIPGLTGWAQINGRDELGIKEKVNLDLYYLDNQSFYLDIKIIFLSFFIFLNKKNIKH